MTKDLTTGKPQSVLWMYSIPMFISVIFQQMYNIADSIIAGKFAGEDALAAVGASYPITMIFMAIAVGSNIGCSVVISKLFGGKRYGRMKTAIRTALISSLIMSIILTIIGLFISSQLMNLLHTPSNVFYDGTLYLRIYIGGFLFLYLYNVCTGIFQSLGDSKTPLWFLICSSLGNIVLDYIFVAICHWGVAGVAWATFIAQGIACLLAIVTLMIRLRSISCEEESNMFSLVMLKSISMIAIPSILQQSFISIGNLLVQGLINGYGSSTIAGYSAAIKLNTFTITSFTTLANGLSCYTAQNIGAGKMERVRDGFRAGIKMTFIVMIPFLFVYYFFGREMLQLFMKSSSVEALDVGEAFLCIVSPFYYVISLKLMADGVLRGAGDMGAFMTSTFVDLILRVILSFILSSEMGTNGIWLSWPIGWVISTILAVLFYRFGRWNKIKNGNI